MRKLLTVVVSWLLALLIGIWGIAFAVATFTSDGHNCFTIGYGSDGAGLINAVCYADGWVLAQRFPENYGRHNGLYCKRSRTGVSHGFSWRVFTPHRVPSRVSQACMLHLLLGITPLAVIDAGLVLVPWFQRRRHRRHGLCVRCGYNLTGSAHDRCSECGTPIPPNTPDVVPSSD